MIEIKIVDTKIVITKLDEFGNSNSSIILTHPESDKLRMELLNAQIAISNAAKVVLVRGGK